MAMQHVTVTGIILVFSVVKKTECNFNGGRSKRGVVLVPCVS